MLQRLSIQNYALIDRLDLEFHTGMNIITGETGAGKSILLGALGLMLGQRSDADALMDKTRKCIVEGLFVAGKNKGAVEDYLKEHDLDVSEQVLIRREVSPEGKSRSFINDTPVNLQQLKELTGMLVDIHSQHQTLLLNKSDFQLSVIDALAGNGVELNDYRIKYKQLITLRANLARLLDEEQKAKSEQDYLRFQWNELEEAALKEGEQVALEKELTTLTNAEEISTRLGQAITELSGGENNLLNQLNNLQQQMQSVAKFDDEIRQLLDRLKSSAIELKDIADEGERLAGRFQLDPERLQIIEQRLDVIYRLQKKHRRNSIEELLELGMEWSTRLSALDNMSSDLEVLESDVLERTKRLTEQAKKISAARQKVLAKTEKLLQGMLVEVALPNAVIKLTIFADPDAIPGPDGIDKIRFLFSANKGFEPSDLGKVASGGELSRLMLCIKAAVANSMELPTMIFDEIDTGISGETALKIGEVMNKMSRYHQLITITHLPQIASRGEAHFFVRKQVVGKKTVTEVVQLDDQTRTIEIARMLSGDQPTKAALQNAKDLLSR